jgi:two-component system cell cycle sensor histidine kinase/response regulator CckA
MRIRGLHSGSGRGRLVVYVVLVLAAAAAAEFAVASGWSGSAGGFGVAEIVAAVLGLATGLLAILLTSMHRNAAAMVVGTGFIGTAVLDGYNAMLAFTMPATGAEMAAWVGTAARLLLAGSILVAWRVQQLQRGSGGRSPVDARAVMTVVAMVVVATISVSVAAPPPVPTKGDPLSHLAELLPTILIALAIAGFLYDGGWRKAVLAHWLMMAQILMFIGQATLILHSRQPNDAAAQIAQMLVVLGYGVAFVGICIRGRVAIIREGEATRRLGAIIDNLLDGVITIDTKGIIQSVSPAAVTMFGHPRQDLIGRNIMMLMPEPHRSAHDGYLSTYAKIGKANVIGSIREVQGLRRNGEVFPLELTVTAVQHGRERLYVGVLRDVSARKAAEREVNQLKLTLDRTLDSVFIFDPETLRFTYVNEGAVEQVGYSGDDLLAMTPVDIMPEFTEMMFRDMIGALAAGPDRSRTFRTVHRHKYGHEIPVEIVLQYIASPDQEPRFVAIVRDITARVKTEDRLRQAKKLKALGLFAGGIAHEFNNLLTSIGGFARMALKKPDDGTRVVDCLNEIVEVSGRAAELTRQMLTFSHRQVLSRSVVRMADLLGGMDTMLRNFIDEHIELAIDCGAGDTCVEIDPPRFTQCIVNLVDNARRAMPDGGRLAIRCEEVSFERDFFTSHGDVLPPGRYCRIAVADDGVGILPEVAQKMFDPFFTTRERGRGAGLGLSLAYGMIKNWGGAIHAESAPGQGSTFSIYLPASDREPGELGPSDELPVEPGGFDRRTILVVEDDAHLRRFAQATLEDAGFRVLTAVDGTDALDIYTANADGIDLLVTDVVMPNMGGVELAHRLTERGHDVKVVYISGYAVELAERVEAEGESIHYLQKPFEPDQLSALVREVLHAH